MARFCSEYNLMLSIIIPSSGDIYLQKTINDVLAKAKGEIEVIVILDGNKDKDLKKDSRVKEIYLEKVIGMRGAINAGIKASTGDWIMKLDSHCIIGQDFDKIMIENCQEDWLMIPSRYVLDEIEWKRNENRFIKNYHYLNFPIKTTGYGYAMTPHELQRMEGTLKNDIDDVMTFQGSCWLANKKYFMEHIGYMDDNPKTYGHWAGDQLELGMKYWLGGGAIKVNKKTWYAHLAKRKHHYVSGQYRRMYKKSRYNIDRYTWASKHWINNEEPNMIHTFDWFIKKFSPVPNWELNWQEIWESYKL